MFENLGGRGVLEKGGGFCLDSNWPPPSGMVWDMHHI